jgi:hypothetical protein
MAVLCWRRSLLTTGWWCSGEAERALLPYLLLFLRARACVRACLLKYMAQTGANAGQEARLGKQYMNCAV